MDPQAFTTSRPVTWYILGVHKRIAELSNIIFCKHVLQGKMDDKTFKYIRSKLDYAIELSNIHETEMEVLEGRYIISLAPKKLQEMQHWCTVMKLFSVLTECEDLVKNS